MMTLAFLAPLLAISPTTTRAEESRWSWIEISSAGGEWRRDGGAAEVVISSGKIQAKLHASDDDDFVLLRIFGTVREIEIQKILPHSIKTLELGKVTATIEPAAADIDSFSCRGEYRKTEVREGYVPESDEALMFYCNGAFYGLAHKLDKNPANP
jgi:hypothetical protein